MNEKPILFSGPMVRAILEGRKTMTRRVVRGKAANVDGEIAKVAYDVIGPSLTDAASFAFLTAGDQGYETVRCPHGGPGDRLWVRETWSTERHIDGSYGRTMPPVFRADKGQLAIASCGWRPSIFMPRWASRITLELTALRVERLQEITEADAKAEGVNGYDGMGFRQLWDALNAKRGYGWDVNPWVWVESFKRVEEKR
jgi:hypothetical protein